MALQYLLIFDILLNPSYLEHLRGTNTEERTNTLSAASHHHCLSYQECEIIAGNRVRLCRGPKRGTCSCTSQELGCTWHIQLLKTHHAAHLWSADKQRMRIMWQVTSFCPLAFVKGQWHALP